MRPNLTIPSILAILFLFASCVKEEKVIDKSITIGNCTINGIKDDIQYITCDTTRNSTFMMNFSARTITFVKENEGLSFSFYNAKRNMAKQLVTRYSDNTKDSLYATSEISISGEPVATYALDSTDTINNYIQITHQENNFTTNMQGIFSATFYKTGGSSKYPDTIKVRDGVINASGLTFPLEKQK